MKAGRLGVVLALVVLLAACGPSPSSSPAAPEPSASDAAQSGLPPGCEAADLRSPTGERLDLTGAWTGTGILVGDNETAWLNQMGDCVFGSVIGGEFLTGDPGPGTTIANLSGVIGADFVIRADVVIVLQEAVFAFAEYSAVDLLIEWQEDGTIRLREDREPGERAGRCHLATFECPAPVIWYRVGEGPPP